ncbi:unnamed protein product, partial [Amoebophrya sp. A25]
RSPGSRATRPQGATSTSLYGKGNVLQSSKPNPLLSVSNPSTSFRRRNEKTIAPPPGGTFSAASTKKTNYYPSSSGSRSASTSNSRNPDSQSGGFLTIRDRTDITVLTPGRAGSSVLAARATPGRAGSSVDASAKTVSNKLSSSSTATKNKRSKRDQARKASTSVHETQKIFVTGGSVRLSSWYYLAPDGLYFGPCRTTELEHWLRKGRIPHSTPISGFPNGPFFPAVHYWDATNGNLSRTLYLDDWFCRWNDGGTSGEGAAGAAPSSSAPSRFEEQGPFALEEMRELWLTEQLHQGSMVRLRALSRGDYCLRDVFPQWDKVFVIVEEKGRDIEIFHEDEGEAKPKKVLRKDRHVEHNKDQEKQTKQEDMIINKTPFYSAKSKVEST